jgi:hypothetical protein
LYNYVKTSDVDPEDYKTPITNTQVQVNDQKPTQNQNLIIENINRENINVNVTQEQVVSKEQTKNFENNNSHQPDENSGM